MPPAVHRLSLLLLPADPDAPSDRVVALEARFQREGWLAGDGPGPRPLVDGGFARARVERFPDVRFASNWQGGFRAACPVDGRNVVPQLGPALEAWRRGGARALACPCGRTHDLSDLAYAPEAGFARGWLALVDVESATLADDARAVAAEELGGVRIVARRG